MVFTFPNSTTQKLFMIYILNIWPKPCPKRLSLRLWREYKLEFGCWYSMVHAKVCKVIMCQHYMSCCYLLNFCNRLLLKRRNPRKRTSPGSKPSAGRATHWNVSCYNSLTNLLLPFCFVHGVLAPGHHVDMTINWIMYDGNMAICPFKLKKLKQCYYPTLPSVHYESAVNFWSWFRIRRPKQDTIQLYKLLKFERISNQS